MSWMWIALIIVIVIIVILVGWGISTYNRLVVKRERISNSISQIAVQTESRWDALVNLIQATKAYAKHEAETLRDIVNSRSRNLAEDASISKIEEENAKFQKALVYVNAVAEAYPDLKASNVYQETMQAVDNYENQVRHSRMIFNDTVTMFNQDVQTFPSSIIAKMGGFKTQEYFKASDNKREMPTW